MKRNKGESKVHSERWLVSYADFITLLFAFFVVLYASAQVDRAKMAALGEAIQQAFQQLGVLQAGKGQSGIAPGMPAKLAPVMKPNQPMDLPQLKEHLEKILAQEIHDRSVALWLGPNGLVISLREMAFFDSGSSSMRRDAQLTFALILSDLHAYDLRVEGHTDNVPIRTSQFHSNWELSTARATEIVQDLITHYQFAPEQLSAAGYAEFHPIASNATEEGRRANRRVDIVVLRLRASPSLPAEKP